MKQILQNLKNGETNLIDAPCPHFQNGSNLIQTSTSLISVGTERMLVDFGKGGLLAKAKQQPDKVRMVFDKIKTDGLLPTIDSVQSKLNQPMAMGYCNVGRIIESDSASEFEIGERVLSNGHHAEVVSVAHNLCAKIPDTVADEDAAFTVIGAIGLQGIRLASPTLGESFAVTGLGLVGLMTVQLLLAQGCRVLGIDFDSKKCALAKSFGAEVVDLSKGGDPVSAAMSFSKSRGLDGVLVCASTKSNEPMHQAANMCRKRGRIVLIGVVGLELSRADFFEKELSFQVSCSYGPGRYDPLYEDKGLDYPVGYVRWTEQRNFEAVLDMMAAGKLNLVPLISHRFPLEKAIDAYDVMAEDRAALGILLEYPEQPIEELTRQTIQLLQSNGVEKSLLGKTPVVGFVGAGNYASRVLIPAFKDAGARLHSVASSGGVSGLYSGKKFGFSETTTDTAGLISNTAVNTLVISSRHNSHARLTCDALQAGKHVFVEKPLCLTLDELLEIESQKSKVPNSLLMLGFNRRFAPHIIKMKDLLAGISAPRSFIMTVNAGDIQADHWTQNLEIGGGRIIGEACHFIDLLRFLAGTTIVKSSAQFMKVTTGDTASIQLAFRDGSIGTVHYFANGGQSFSKERLEVFASGSILQLDNFRMLRGYNWPGFKKMKLSRQDKGQKNCAAAFVQAIQCGGQAPISAEEIFEVSRAAIVLAGGEEFTA